MRNAFLEMRYYETYYYANIIHNVLNDPFPYIRHVHSWYEDQELKLLQPFPAWSALHDFTEFVIGMLMDEQDGADRAVEMQSNPRAQLWVEDAMRHHGIKSPAFRTWLTSQGIGLAEVNEDHIADYYQEHSEAIGNMTEKMVNEVFYVLFPNRGLLARLNSLAAGAVANVDRWRFGEDSANLMTTDGRVARVAIPKWVQRAVMFRDKGMCACCSKDISGLLTSQPDQHYDHIVPLAQHGINDVTNIQLLCSACNLGKGPKPEPPSNRYEAWY